MVLAGAHHADGGAAAAAQPDVPHVLGRGRRSSPCSSCIIGVAVGFVLQIVFDALAMGGQLLANTMGLSFAFNVDPLRGTGAPVVGQFYTLIATLTFLALNGHIAVVQALVDGFSTHARSRRMAWRRKASGRWRCGARSCSAAR